MRAFTRFFALGMVLSPIFAAGQQPDQQTPDQQQRRGPGGREFRGVFGEITEISGSTLKIKQPNGKMATVIVNSNTRFRREREEAKLTDFKVGDNVMVRGDSTGENAWTAQLVASAPSQAEMQQRMKEAMGKTIVIGDVKSVDPPKLTIQRTDGVEQTIEADENTSFRKGRGESITLPDIKTGDTIFARGELKDGVFVPTNINLIDPAMAQRIKQGGGMMFLGSGSGPGGARDQQGSNSTRQQSPPQQIPKQ